MGNEVEKLPYIIRDALLAFAEYVLKNEPNSEEYALEVERQTERICKAISEAGYICVGKGVISPWDNADGGDAPIPCGEKNENTRFQ